jgi:cytochrome oxidase assembly protein ShyY1
MASRISQFSESPAESLSSVQGVAAPEWSRVALVGEWMASAVMFHDNRVYERRPGYHVLMPLRLQDGSTVLVNRGWVAAGMNRAVLPEIATPADSIELMGRVMVPEHEPFSLGENPRDGARWQFIDLAAYRDWSNIPVAPWVVQQMSETGDGLVRDWPAPALGVDTHRGYALQWYSLAALAIALTGFYVFRSFRKNAA